MPQRSLLTVLLAALLTAAAPIHLTAQTPPSAEAKTQRLRIAELNCENLFDTLHTEGHDDHEFLPQAERRWDTRRYWHKLSMLAREIVSLSPMEPVDMLALTEVESDTVLRDLTRRTRLSRLNYRYIITHGSDRRGINVALLYREGSLRPLSIKSLCWQQRAGIVYPTRDALHVSGLLRSGDTANIIVCFDNLEGTGDRVACLEHFDAVVLQLVDVRHDQTEIGLVLIRREIDMLAVVLEMYIAIGIDFVFVTLVKQPSGDKICFHNSEILKIYNVFNV